MPCASLATLCVQCPRIHSTHPMLLGPRRPPQWTASAASLGTFGRDSANNTTTTNSANNGCASPGGGAGRHHRTSGEGRGPRTSSEGRRTRASFDMRLQARSSLDSRLTGGVRSSFDSDWDAAGGPSDVAMMSTTGAQQQRACSVPAASGHRLRWLLPPPADLDRIAHVWRMLRPTAQQSTYARARKRIPHTQHIPPARTCGRAARVQAPQPPPPAT